MRVNVSDKLAAVESLSVCRDGLIYHAGVSRLFNTNVVFSIWKRQSDSSLKISALEQIRFIEKLVKEYLPFDKQIMRTVKRVMINEEADSYILHGKTGTRLSDMGLGWFVGYVETKKRDWVFATNIDGSGSDAKAIPIEALEQLKIIKVE